MDTRNENLYKSTIQTMTTVRGLEAKVAANRNGNGKASAEEGE